MWGDKDKRVGDWAEYESINRDIQELKNKHVEINNIITEIRNMLEGINSRISEAEE